MRRWILLTLTCLPGALMQISAQSPAQIVGQIPPAATSPVQTLTARSTLVLVPALVRDKAGELVFTLKADDFVLTDDGIPQKLTLEQDTDGLPLALVVDIEGGGAGARELAKYHALSPMLESVVGDVPHLVAIVGFDSSPVLVQDFTSNIDLAAHGIQALIADDNGDDGAAILDSLGFSLDLLRKQPSQYRRAILLISESNDRGSKVKLDEALRAISDTNTAIYSIGFSSGRDQLKHESAKALGDSTPGPAHGCMSRDPNDPNVNLKQNPAEQAYDCLSCWLLRSAWPRQQSSPPSKAFRKTSPRLSPASPEANTSSSPPPRVSIATCKPSPTTSPTATCSASSPSLPTPACTSSSSVCPVTQTSQSPRAAATGPIRQPRPPPSRSILASQKM